MITELIREYGDSNSEIGDETRLISELYELFTLLLSNIFGKYAYRFKFLFDRPHQFVGV